MEDLGTNAGKGSPVGNLAANFSHSQLPTSVPPIGVFWDIENCQVPKGKSTSALVQCIRTRFFSGHREAEFMCVCDIGKERKEVIKDLNLAQVTVVHVNATSKNAADDKLKQCMRRFVDIHGSPSTVLLISGDVNFATDLCDFRHRRNIRIILLHSVHATQPLIACAHEAYSFSELTASLPRRSPAKKEASCRCQLIVNDLPTNRDYRQIQNRLCQLADNCGGKVKSIINGRAILQFSSHDAARRAKKRMDKEDVFGSKISVLFPTRSLARDAESSPQRSGNSRTRSMRYAEGTSDSSRDSSPMHNGGSSDSAMASTSRSRPGTTDRGFLFPPPPDLISQNYLRQDNVKSVQTDLTTEPSSNPTSGTFSDFLYDSARDGRSWFYTQESASGLSADSGRSRESSPYTAEGNKTETSTSRNKERASPFPAPEFHRQNSYRLASSWTTSVEEHLRWRDGSLEHKEPMSLGARTAFPQTHHHFPHFSSCRTSPVPVNVTQVLGRSLPTVGFPQEDPPSSNVPAPVELQVTNLDQNIEANEMKKILLSVFREHVMVLHISMVLQSDRSLKAVIKVPSLQDAQFAISQLHRRKIGYKRILISYVATDRMPPLHVLKSEVIALINDIPSKKLPLFKFRDLYEKRYHRTISISDLYKLRDAIIIQEETAGRTVLLNPDFRGTPSPTDSEDSQETLQSIEKPYCELHYHIIETQCWAEKESVYPLPDVRISLKTFAPRVHTLLDTHQGLLPLNSFCACYEAEFGDPLMPPTEDKVSAAETPDTNLKSVPLEHLIACVPGVQITRSMLGIKKVQWLDNKSTEQELRVLNPALACQLALFSREMVDLLKNQPKCSMPFNKFIPAYHHHFGRQCRVADYGFTKLIDLLEAIPHVIQILGQGQKRVLTLTHHAQAKRFAADLLRILKSRASKQIKLSELPAIYEQCIGRPFDIASYGVCDLSDMMNEVSENTVVITAVQDDTIVAIPKREQTPEEIERTKQFAKEVVELLKHTPTCSMPFTKFVPSYHHHFGRQCRVADYGFSKLIELFEATPDVVEVVGTGEEKMIILKEKERLQVLAEKIIAVLEAQPSQMILLSRLCSAYTQVHGHALKPEEFGASSVVDLIGKLRHSLKIVDTSNGPFVTLVDKEQATQVSLHVRKLLMEEPDGKMTWNELSRRYQDRFSEHLNRATIEQNMEGVVLVVNNVVSLAPIQLFARDVITLLCEHGGQILLQNFESAFLKRFGTPCRPAQFNFPSLVSLLQTLPEYFVIRGKRSKRMVVLNQGNSVVAESELSECDSPKPAVLPSGRESITGNRDLASSLKQMQLNEPELIFACNSPVDLLSQPIPSGVPSPEIAPELHSMDDCDLMGFESPIPELSNMMAVMTEHERQQLKTPPLCQDQNFPASSTPAKPAAPSYVSATVDPVVGAMFVQPSCSSAPHPFVHTYPFIPSHITAPAFAPLPSPSWLSQQFIMTQQAMALASRSSPLNSSIIIPSIPTENQMTMAAPLQRSPSPIAVPAIANAASPQICRPTYLGSAPLMTSFTSHSPSSSTPTITGDYTPSMENMVRRAPSSSPLLPSPVQSMACRSRTSIASCTDLSSPNQSLDSSANTHTSSSPSTPTHSLSRQQSRCRIAAQFSVPLEPPKQ